MLWSEITAAARNGAHGVPGRRNRGRWIWVTALAAGIWGSAVAAAPTDPKPLAPPTHTTPTGVPLMPASGYSYTQIPPIRLPGAVEPAGFQQPEAQPPAKLPPPRSLPFGDEKVRLPRLAGTGQLGVTPIPTEKDLEEYRQFVDGVIDPRNTLDLIEGRARVVILKATPTRTQIADPEVATFRILEPNGRQMTIIGAKPGITVLNLWFTDPANKDKEKILSYLVRVLPDPEAKERLEAIYKALEIEINKAFPNSRIRLTLVGDKLMVSGQAHDIHDATQILRILRANAPDQGGGQAQRPPFVPLSSYSPTGQPFDPLRPSLTPGLENYETLGGPNVINNMRVPGEQQVMLRVVVAEVNRAAARSIGVNFSFLNNNNNQTGNGQNSMVFGQLTGAVAQAANLPVNLDNGQIPIAINALRVLNYARTLAEPNLTTMNGQMATFLAGGMFPVPVLGGNGNLGGLGAIQGVQFVPFGVQLMFTPIITDRDRIRLTMMTTVSVRDNQAATNIAGANVPGLNARTFMTTVELREGQTMAVAGLIETDLGATAERVPFFGDIPFLGRLASFQRITSAEKELVVLVTPELVHPLNQSELPQMIPGSDIFEPGDLEFYLAGRLESRRCYDYRASVRTDIHRMLSYRHCELNYIVGPCGHGAAPEPSIVPAVEK